MSVNQPMAATPEYSQVEPKELEHASNNDDNDDETEQQPDESIVQDVLEICQAGNLEQLQALCAKHGILYARYQSTATGRSPLMAAAQHGHLKVVTWLLLVGGAPWNALDRTNQCAGNYATQSEHWEIVDCLVNFGTQAELLLGQLQQQQQYDDDDNTNTTNPACKPNYLQSAVRYDDTKLLDSDNDAVMMEWERPIMKAHADLLFDSPQIRTVLNIGFGMGIIDTYLQEHNPDRHIIVEAHPGVYQKMKEEGWDQKDTVRILFGTWQDELPKLLLQEQDNFTIDAIFFDTYGEHENDLMEGFIPLASQLLTRPYGVLSYFNGFAPDNLFFHGVACQVHKIKLAQCGLEVEYYRAEIEKVPNNNNNNNEWEGVARPYWHDRSTYYLPICKWNPTFVMKNSNDNEEDDDTVPSPLKRTAVQSMAKSMVKQTKAF